MTKNKTPPKIPRGTAPNVIYNNLKADIFSGKLVGGCQLHQSEVAERFGNSMLRDWLAFSLGAVPWFPPFRLPRSLKCWIFG